jgi:hypothetical protein
VLIVKLKAGFISTDTARMYDGGVQYSVAIG